ncbi:MAG: acyl-CoA carboxylase subunit epsilon [Nocardia sp.]|nr:acyl-CoA carboxylase subunit epsilon [Nocardia sp.]
MTAVADEEILRAAELDLAVGGLDGEVESLPEALVPAEPDSGPVIRILKGSPSDAEIAALITVFAAASASAGAVPQQQAPVDNWGLPTSMHRGAASFTPYSFPEMSQLRA